MYPRQSPLHKKESNVGPFESISTLLVSELALFCKKLFPSTSQDSGCPRENVDADNEFLNSLHRRPTQSWNSVFLCLPVPSSLLHLVTLREVRDREFLGIRGAPRRCASTTNQVLELCRLDEICVHRAMHFIDRCCPTVSSRLRAVFLGNHSDLVNNHPLLDHKSD